MNKVSLKCRIMSRVLTLLLFVGFLTTNMPMTALANTKTIAAPNGEVRFRIRDYVKETTIKVKGFEYDELTEVTLYWLPAVGTELRIDNEGKTLIDVETERIYFNGYLRNKDGTYKGTAGNGEWLEALSDGSIGKILKPYDEWEVNEGDSVTAVKYGDFSIFITFTNETAMPAPIDENKQGVLSTALKATPIASRVYINDKEISFDAYNIEGSNYFKLRDLACSLNATEKQFDVSWDNTVNAINLISNEVYTVTNGEMEKGDGITKDTQPTTSTILLDGKEVQLTAYNIAGSNYFKLRDIGKLFNFAVDWDGANNAIKIDTSKPYTE